MKCEKCGQIANVHITEIRDGKKTDQNLCETCANALKVGTKPLTPISKLLEDFVAAHSGKDVDLQKLINAAKRNSQRPEERFSDRSKVDYAAAQQKARNLGFEYIGTETMLLVLIEDRNSGVSELIENLGVDLKTRGKHLLALIGIGSQAVPEGKLPKTPRLWRSIKWAAEEADNLGHDIIEPEHILLGMLREGTGSSAMALVKLGVTIENAREAVWNKYASPPDSGPIPGQ